jgi:hypothetical protein
MTRIHGAEETLVESFKSEASNEPGPDVPRLVSEDVEMAEEGVEEVLISVNPEEVLPEDDSEDE